MGNTVVRGGAPAIQIAGALSDGILFQNLSPSAPLYLGYQPTVTSGTFSGYVAPGGSYTTPKGKDVWIYADADCAIVYDYTPDAQPGAGSQVAATPAQAQTVLFAPKSGFSISGPSVSNDLIAVEKAVDVSTYSFVLFSLLDFSQPASVTAGYVNLNLIWLDANGAYINVDTITVMRFGAAYGGIRVKGKYLAIRVVTDANMPALSLYKGTFTLTTQLLSEWTNVQSFWQAQNFRYFNIASSSYNSEVEANNGANAPHTASFNFTVNAGVGAYYLFDTWKGAVSGAYYVQGGQFYIRPINFGHNITDNLPALIASGAVGAATPFSTRFSAQPYEIFIYNDQTAAKNYSLTLAYE